MSETMDVFAPKTSGKPATSTNEAGEKTGEKKGLTKEIKFAITVAVLVLATYATLATVAANLMVSRELNRKGFKSVQVEKPISFIDTTYVVKQTTPAPEKPKVNP